VTVSGDKGIEICQDIVATRASEMISEREGVGMTEAIRMLMATKTYALLLDPRSYLYLESAEYVLDMFLAELRGDWEYWARA
jgi:hypothetical protein